MTDDDINKTSFAYETYYILVHITSIINLQYLYTVLLLIKQKQKLLTKIHRSAKKFLGNILYILLSFLFAIIAFIFKRTQH